MLLACPRSKKSADTEAKVHQALAALSHKEFPNTHQAAKLSGCNGLHSVTANGGALRAHVALF